MFDVQIHITIRAKIKTPSIPLHRPYNTPQKLSLNEKITLRSLDHSSYFVLSHSKRGQPWAKHNGVSEKTSHHSCLNLIIMDLLSKSSVPSGWRGRIAQAGKGGLDDGQLPQGNATCPRRSPIMCCSTRCATTYQFKALGTITSHGQPAFGTARSTSKRIQPSAAYLSVLQPSVHK